MGKRAIATILAGMALVGAGSAWGQQFDLRCKDDGKPYDHYRIDLGAKQWCAGNCAKVKSIAAVTDRTLRLSEIDMADSIPMRIEIDRTTGEWHTRFFSGSSWIEESMTCEPAPFSGFPEVKQKF